MQADEENAKTWNKLRNKKIQKEMGKLKSEASILT